MLISLLLVNPPRTSPNCLQQWTPRKADGPERGTVRGLATWRNLGNSLNRPQAAMTRTRPVAQALDRENPRAIFCDRPHGAPAPRGSLPRSALMTSLRAMFLFTPARQRLRRSSCRKDRSAPCVALRPGCLQLRLAEVPVGPAALQDGAQVVAQLFDGGPAEEPVAHVDLVDAQARIGHERVRDHRVVVRVSVLGDVEVLLHLAAWIGKEGPARADAGAELVRLGQAVSADGHQPAVPDLHLAMKLQEPFHLQPVLGTEASAAEYQHQRVGPLQLGELAAIAAVIGQLIVRERRSRNDVGSHFRSSRSGTSVRMPATSESTGR